MAKLVSQSCGKLQLSNGLSRGDGAIRRPPEHLWTSNKPQKQATATGKLSVPIPAWIVNVYSYCLMVKSMSCCCVLGRWISSNPATCACCSWLKWFGGLYFMYCACIRRIHRWWGMRGQTTHVLLFACYTACNMIHAYIAHVLLVSISQNLFHNFTSTCMQC